MPLQSWGPVSQQHRQGTELLGDGQAISPSSEIRSWLWALLAVLLTVGLPLKGEVDFVLQGHLALSVGVSVCHN